MKISSLLHNLIVALLFGIILQPFFGLSNAATASGVIFLAGFIPGVYEQKNVAYAGLLKEVWLDVFMHNFYRNAPFLSRSVDMTSFVENNAINLAEGGIDPEVYINNTTYPISTAEFDANALSLPLGWFDTQNMRVKNVLKKQFKLDAVGVITNKHKMKMLEVISDKTAHAWAPASNSAQTPVFATSGADRGDGFKKFSLSDIAKMQELFDNAKFPQTGRILVLHPSHRADILNENKDLFKQFADLKAGEVLPIYGFDVYVYSGNPVYNKTTGAKKAFGAVAAPATDTVSSLFYLESEVMKAEGEMDMFYKPSAINTENRADEIGFQKFYIGLPIRNKGIGAVYSAAA